MFFHKKIILFINATTLSVYSVSSGTHPKIKLLVKQEWRAETLASLLRLIKKKTGSTIRVLISEELAYTTYIALPSQLSANRYKVKEKAEALIPENLNFTAWDFIDVLAYTNAETDQSTTVIQVVALTQSFFDAFSKTMGKTGFHIEVMQPVSYTFSELLRREKEPVIVVYTETKPLLIVINKGLVVATEYEENPLTTEALQAFLHRAERHHAIHIGKVLLTGTSEIDEKILVKSGLKVQSQSLNPLVSLASYKDDGKDQNTLSLSFEKKKLTSDQKEDEEDQDEETSTEPPGGGINKQTIELFLLFLLLGFIGVMVFIAFRPQSKGVNKNSAATNAKPKPSIVSLSPAITVINTATPAAQVDISKYTLTILNGSGKSGAAGVLAKTLQEKGYAVIKTDNADTNVSQTELHLKNTVPDNFKLTLDKELKTFYASITEDKNLADDYPTNAEIIIGTQ